MIVHWPLFCYLDEAEIISADNMLPAIEVEFGNGDVNNIDQSDGITNMDIDEDSASGNNIIYIIYKNKK